MSDLRVELLYTLDCPHWEHVRADLHRVLSEGTIETPIQLVLVSGEDDAEFLDFVGSPTVRLNGVDVAPPPPGSRPNTGCRLYVQPDGSLSGRIPESLLREAIRSHRRGRLEEFQRQEAGKVAAAALEAAEDERADAGGGAATHEDTASHEAAPSPDAAASHEAAPRHGAAPSPEDAANHEEYTHT